jgi:single stranded DNA-binding protein
MNLIKPAIWHEESDPAHQHRPQAGSAEHATRPQGRRSPLTARTAKLLQHLRAFPPGDDGCAADDVPGDAACAVVDEDADLNRVQLTGVLGSEPLLYDVGDHPVAALALACQRRWRSPSGSVQLATTWFNLSAWEELAEQCGRQLHRGDRVYVEGYLHLWTETRPPQSYACHTIVLDRIVLLVAGGRAAEGDEEHP